MKKLFVAGCSFSDYTGISQTYGELLAEKINYQYIHEGAGCGSNYRIWRKITNYVLENQISSDDLLIIQYTNYTRNEFFTPLSHRVFQSSKYKLCLVDKSYDDGNILRYKLGAASWQKYPEEQDFFEIYERSFINESFEKEKFIINNYNFQRMLEYHKIPTIFLDTFRILKIDNYVIDYFQNISFQDRENLNSLKYNLDENDASHMNQEGHLDLCNRLHNHILKNKLIKE